MGVRPHLVGVDDGYLPVRDGNIGSPSPRRTCGSSVGDLGLLRLNPDYRGRHMAPPAAGGCETRWMSGYRVGIRRRLTEASQPSNQLSNNACRWRRTPADSDRRLLAGQMCRSAGGPLADLASGRRGHPVPAACQNRAETSDIGEEQDAERTGSHQGNSRLTPCLKRPSKQ